MAPARQPQRPPQSGAPPPDNARVSGRGRSRSPLRRNPKFQKPPEPKEPPKPKPPKRGEEEGTTPKSAPSRPAKEEPGGEATSSSGPDPSHFAGTKYGCWNVEKLSNRPRCLHLFSGPQRKGDLADQLLKLGWAVCSCDIKQPVPTNLLDQATRAAILKDIDDQKYDAMFLGTPCETYSALREIRPGPKPLRSPNELRGISKGLTEAEKKQLAEGNSHTDFSAEAMTHAHKVYLPFTLENPEPLHPVSLFNIPAIKEVSKLRGVRTTDFDQCRVGCEAKKPTRLLRYRMEYSGLDGMRCNHEPNIFKDADGKEYKAAHEKVAQRRRTTADGKSEYASKALGNYATDFCVQIARAVAKVNMERAMKARELLEERIP